MFPLRDLNPTRITPLLTIAVAGANIVVFFGWQPFGDVAEATAFVYERAAIACELLRGEPLTLREIVSGVCSEGATGPVAFPEKQLWLSVLVSLFLHGGIAHVLGNMWFLWIFGNNVEEAFGHLGYALLYLAGGVAATAVFVLMHPVSTVPLVGASGAVAAVLGAYFVLYPTHWILTLIVFYVVPVPAVVFLGVWFAGQFAVADVGVAWEAHVGGFVFGASMALVLRQPLLRRVQRLHGGSLAVRRR
jgi:membrane associated rhomboid family serine protease